MLMMLRQTLRTAILVTRLSTNVKPRPPWMTRRTGQGQVEKQIIDTVYYLLLFYSIGSCAKDAFLYDVNLIDIIASNYFFHNCSTWEVRGSVIIFE